MKFATPSEALDAGIAALTPVIPILKQIEDCERRLGEVQQQLGSARAESKSLEATINAKLAHSVRLDREIVAKEQRSAQLDQQHQRQLAAAQQELEAVTHKRDEAQAELNRIDQTVEDMRRMLSAKR